eukprot:1195092-Prorocentrum_minimum.AAC.7
MRVLGCFKPTGAPAGRAAHCVALRQVAMQGCTQHPRRWGSRCKPPGLLLFYIRTVGRLTSDGQGATRLAPRIKAAQRLCTKD